MSNKIDLLKLKLSTYLIEIENYQPYKIEQKIKKQSYNSYFTNLTNSHYQIIEMIEYSQWKIENLTQSNQKLQEIKDTLKIQNHTKINTLTIILTENEIKKEVGFNRENIIFINNDNFINKLETIFNKITMIKDQEESKISNKVDKTENLENDSDAINYPDAETIESDPKLQKKIQDFGTLLQNNNVIVSWTLILLILAPLLLVLFSKNLSNYGLINSDILKLLLGASESKLVFIAYQFWRWFTYPFAPEANMVTMPLNIIVIFAIWHYGKLAEILFKPWRLGLILLLSVFIVGLVHSTVVLNEILSGPAYLLWIILGSLYAYGFNTKGITSFIARKKLVAPTVLLAFFVLKDMRDFYLVIMYALAFITGFFISYAIGFNKDMKFDWKRVVAFAFPAILIIASVIFYLTNKNLPTDFRAYFKGTLTIYHDDFSIISTDYYERMKNILKY